jgi:ornithine cyclodeaminase/alanine dehydrogenase-like protein (mu-crystallin family)
MRLLVVSAADVHSLLGYGECADAMRAALTAVQLGRAHQPLRTVMRPEGAAGLVALMPAYLSGSGSEEDKAAYGLKTICITPGNPADGLDTHQGIVLLSSGRTGEPQAVLNASAVTEIRTAAVSIVATDLLARPDADVLAVIGTGVQGRAHVLALSATRKLSEIRLTGRDPARTGQAAAVLSELIGGRVQPCATVAEAVAGAGIVVTATSSAQPVLRGEWLEPGMHINAVGACLPTTRELDSAAMAAGVLFADSRASLLAESGDYLMAASDGVVGPAHIRAELGEILTGSAQGRANDSEITIFESLGLAIEDLAAGALAYRKAATGGNGGTWTEF